MATFMYKGDEEILVEACDVQAKLKQGYCFTREEAAKAKEKASAKPKSKSKG